MPIVVRAIYFETPRYRILFCVTIVTSPSWSKRPTTEHNYNLSRLEWKLCDSKDKEKMMVNFYKLCFVSGSMPLIHVWLFLSFLLSRLRSKWRQNPMKTKPLALIIESSNKMQVFQAVFRMVMNNELHLLIASIITYLVSGFFYAVGYKINGIQ